jgi:cytochrome c peroxidase
MASGGVCLVQQFADHPDCNTIFPNVTRNSNAALAAAIAARSSDPDVAFPDNIASPPSDGPPLVAFLAALNDPCTTDRACLAPWIPAPSGAPDDHQLNATDGEGNPL